MTITGQTGRVHLYEGDGKGKTTAAVGLAVRALGCGHRVLFCQFLKSGKTGELGPLEQLGATLLRAEHCGKFTFQMDREELSEAKTRHQACLSQVGALMGETNPHLVVLDEVLDAVNAGLIPCEALLELIEARPAGTELVLTGRSPDHRVLEAADYHTAFLCQKHPYQQGLAARRGIEY